MSQPLAATTEVALKPAAGYLRESTEEQGQGWSPDVQRKAISQWAAEHGYFIVDWYVDFVSGRDAEKRGEFKRLIEEAQTGRFVAVLAFHTSRFARNSAEASAYKKLLRKKLGIEVTFVTQHFGDPNDPNGWLNERLNEVIDEHQSITIGFWVAHGLREKRSQGYLVGMLPYGLTRPAPDNRKDAVAHPDEAPVVRDIYERYASGTETYGTIAVRLNDRGLRGRRGKPWTKDTVREVLSNATYAGYLTRKRGRLEGAERGKFEALVTDDLWNRVRSVRERRTVSQHGARPTKRHYLLSGVVVCLRCGGRMNGIATGRKHDFRRYACANRTKRHACDQPFARAEELETEVDRFVSSFRLDHDPALADDVAQLAEATWQKVTGASGPTDEQVEGRLARLRDLYELGDIAREEYLTRRGRLINERETARPATSFERDKCLAALSNWEKVWDSEPDVAAKREFLRIAFDSLVAEDGRLREVVLKPETAPLFLAEQRGCQSGSDGTRTRGLRRDRPAL